VLGTLEAVQAVLAPPGWPSPPAFVERSTRPIRPHGAAVGRRVRPRCQGADGLLEPWAVGHCYDPCCLPHARVRQPLPQPEPTNGSGSAQVWWPWTPAMAAGLTDPGWTRREVWLCRGPPGPPPAGG
jgi:hypothetical protein